VNGANNKSAWEARDLLAKRKDAMHSMLGEQFLITAGPLAGLQGSAVKCLHPSRYLLSLSLAPRGVFVEIDESQIELSGKNSPSLKTTNPVPPKMRHQLSR
jgi:hypothetical protein